MNRKSVFTAGVASALAVTLVIGGGTLAYLRSVTDNVTNTFQTNEVQVELKETTGSSYNIIPGTTQKKDPTVTVRNTADAYVYVAVSDATDGLVDYTVAAGWTALDGVADVYYREVAADAEAKSFPVLQDDTVSYDAALENSDMLQNGALKTGVELTFAAEAVQKAPFNDPVKAYFQTEDVVTVDAEATADDLSQAISQAAGRRAIVVENIVATPETIQVPADKEIVLSLGKDAAVVNEKSHAIHNEGSLEIVGGTLDAKAHASAAVYNEPGATLELNNVKLIRSQESGENADENGGNSYYVVLNHGTMTLNNCQVEAIGGYSSLVENGWQNGAQNTGKTDAVMTINGGVFTGGLNTIKNDDYGVLVINGGVFNNAHQQVLLNHHIATVNGGAFYSTAGGAIYNCACNPEIDKGILTVTGGVFNYNSKYWGVYDADTAASVISLSGGRYATSNICNKENAVADGYKIAQEADGSYSIIAQ